MSSASSDTGGRWSWPARSVLTVVLLAQSAPVFARCADVALVLAIDGSGSVTEADFEMQTMGYVIALNDPGVWQAFQAAGTVDLAAVYWGDSAFGAQVFPWQRVTSAKDLQVFAATMAATERRVSGNTDIGVAINAAIDLFSEPGRCAERTILDISGDGRSTVIARRREAHALSPARGRAQDLGIVINALAIAETEKDLAEYYRRNVAVGSGSFVMEVEGFASFAGAITRKLKKELLAGLDVPACGASSAAAPEVCTP